MEQPKASFVIVQFQQSFNKLSKEHQLILVESLTSSFAHMFFKDILKALEQQQLEVSMQLPPEELKNQLMLINQTRKNIESLVEFYTHLHENRTTILQELQQ